MSTSTSNEIVLLQDIIKNYGQGKVVTHALRGVNFKLIEGVVTHAKTQFQCSIHVELK